MGAGRTAACALVAGLTLFAVGMLFYLAVPVIAPIIPPQFGNSALFRPWAGWTSTYMVLHPFGFGVVFAVVYFALVARGGARSGWRSGLVFGFGVFTIGSLPVFLLVFASFQVSPEVVASWVVQSACQYTAAGAAIGWVARRSEPLYGPANLNKNDNPDPRCEEPGA
jgi:hypothetical protein